MRLPPIHLSQVFKHVEHIFLTTPPSTRSGFKVLSVCPKDAENCLLVIDLDARGSELSHLEVMVKVEDSLRISTYILNQSLVDIVSASATKDKEKKDDETQH